MHTSRPATWMVLMMLGACGGAVAAPASVSHAPAPVPMASTRVLAASAAPAPRQEESDPGVEIPTSCAEGSRDPCLPDAPFAQRLCEAYKPGIALAMFAKGTPWQRAYVRGRSIVAWKATGAATEKVSLVFDEELIIIRHRTAAPGGMTVSGASDSYDVIRWDGNCVSVDGNEITRYLPPSPKYPELPWKHYDDRVQEALLGDDAVVAAYKARRNECKGVTMGAVSDACAKANHALSTAVVRFVRAGGRVPLPDRLL